MRLVLEGIMARLGAGPLPEAVVISGDDTSWRCDKKQCDPAVAACSALR